MLAALLTVLADRRPTSLIESRHKHGEGRKEVGPSLALSRDRRSNEALDSGASRPVATQARRLAGLRLQAPRQSGTGVRGPEQDRNPRHESGPQLPR